MNEVMCTVMEIHAGTKAALHHHTAFGLPVSLKQVFVLPVSLKQVFVYLYP